MIVFAGDVKVVINMCNTTIFEYVTLKVYNSFLCKVIYNNNK